MVKSMSNPLEAEILMKFVVIIFSNHCIQCSILLHFHLITRYLSPDFPHEI